MGYVENSILSSFRAGILAIRLDGTVAYINPIGEKILKDTPVHPGENIHFRAGENPFFRVLSEAVEMHYLPTRVEIELPAKDGERQDIGFTLSELKEEDTRIGICAFFKDLTHVEMAEESENLKQRLLLLGQMVAGLAHEIRNPISSIGVHCSILKNHLNGHDKLLSSVTMIAREVDRVEYIIRECMNFVRPADLALTQVAVDGTVEEIVERFRTLHPGMEFAVRKQDEAVFYAEVDAGLLEQAIGNIVSNAVYACGEKGRIEISFGMSRHYSDLLRPGRSVDPIGGSHPGREEDFIRITIADDGPGIPPEIVDKIFVPFFTTKKTGTGLGLPLSQKIIHAHGGVLDLQSRPGGGTEFIIKIPVRQEWRTRS